MYVFNVRWVAEWGRKGVDKAKLARVLTSGKQHDNDDDEEH